MNIEKIKLSLLLTLNNDLPTDLIRNIWEFLEEDFKRKINFQYINNIVANTVDEWKRRPLNQQKCCFFIHPFPFPYPDIGIGSIHDNFKSLCIPNNPLFKSMLTSIVRKYNPSIEYSHDCCDGNGFGFKKMHPIYNDFNMPYCP